MHRRRRVFWIVGNGLASSGACNCQREVKKDRQRGIEGSAMSRRDRSWMCRDGGIGRGNQEQLRRGDRGVGPGGLRFGAVHEFGEDGSED